MAEMLNCQQIFERLQDYLDRELSAEEIAQVKMHLDVCGVCAEEYRFEESVLHHVRSCLCEAQVPADLASRLMRAIDNEG
jgi:anti-sigma factor (TIGR02949 family)